MKKEKKVDWSKSLFFPEKTLAWTLRFRGCLVATNTTHTAHVFTVVTRNSLAGSNLGHCYFSIFLSHFKSALAKYRHTLLLPQWPLSPPPSSSFFFSFLTSQTAAASQLRSSTSQEVVGHLTATRPPELEFGCFWGRGRIGGQRDPKDPPDPSLTTRG